MDVVVLGADLKDSLFPRYGSHRQDDADRWASVRSDRSGQGQGQRVRAIAGQLHLHSRSRRTSRFTAPRTASATISRRSTGTGLKEAQDEVRIADALLSATCVRSRTTLSRSILGHAGVGWDQLTGAIAAAAVGIVSVFMVVGGVVIMNIMLAVVSERTREIGVRKSVGARRQDILNQFLVESSMLAGIRRIDRRQHRLDRSR